MIGKLIIENQYYHGNARDDYEDDPNLKFECGKEFMENFISKDSIRLGMNWFNLPSIEEMLNELDELYPVTKKVEFGNDYDIPLEDIIVSEVE